MTKNNKLYANILYEIIDKNNHIFTNFENDILDYSLDLDLLDKYILENQYLKKCFVFLKDLLSNYTYIDKQTTINILNENCNKINKIINDNNKIPIIIIPNNSFKKSNFFFTLYFMYLFKTKNNIIIEYVFYDFYKKQSENSLNDTLFYISNNICQYYNDDMNKNNYLAIICDDFIYSGSQMCEFIKCDSYIKINFPNNFNIYINCIGCSNKGYELIKKIYKDDIIISDEIYYKNQLSINDIIKHKYNIEWNEKINEYKKKEKYKKKSNEVVEFFESNNIRADIIKELCFKNDIFILVNDELSNKLKLKSILLSYVKKNFLISYNNLTMVYLFLKYPDSISTIKGLCAFDLSINNNYYIIENDTNNQIIKDKYKYIYDNNSEDVMFDLNNKSDGLYINFENNDIKIIQKQNNLPSLIILQKNCKPETSKFIECNDYCFTPFYKKIDWINIYDINYDINYDTEIIDIFLNSIKIKNILEKYFNNFDNEDKDNISTIIKILEINKINTKSLDTIIKKFNYEYNLLNDDNQKSFQTSIIHIMIKNKLT